MKALFLCHPRCTTCAKARKWLADNRVEFEERSIQAQNPTAAELALWHRQSGLPLRRFFNTSGQLYRELELAKKLPDMSEEEMLALLATDGMLVKRPLLICGETVRVGFKEAEWEAVKG